MSESVYPMTFPVAFKSQLDAIRQMAQLEGAGDYPDDVVMEAKDVGVRAADVGGRADDPENAIGLVVHDGQGAFAGHCQHAVAHAVDHVAKEPIANRRRGRLLSRGPSSGLRARRAHVSGDGAQAV